MIDEKLKAAIERALAAGFRVQLKWNFRRRVMYYTIRQMAEMFDVTEHTLRFYTDKGLLPCERDGGNRRVFNEESVNWMQGIKCLKGCGAVRNHPKAARGSQGHSELHGRKGGAL